MESKFQCENEILTNYKDLVISLESSRQLYEEVIEQTETNLLPPPTSNDIIRCSRVVAYIDIPRIVTWQIRLLNGKIIYSSDTYLQYEEWSIDINTLDLLPYDQFVVVGVIEVHDHISNQIFTYVSDSNATIYLQFAIWTATSSLNYIGTVPLFYLPNAEPTLKCKSIFVDKYIHAISKITLYTLDGLKLYESDNLVGDTSWGIDFLYSSIKPYTILRMKANVSSGNDCIADVVMQYDPDSIYRANYTLIGNAIQSVFEYTGVKKITAPTIKQCSDIIAYDHSNMIVKWEIILLDGTRIYQSDKNFEFDTFYLKLENLAIEPGTQIRLRANVLSGYLTSKFVLEYTPSYSTIYYALEGLAGSDDNDVVYYGLIESPYRAPILKCSKITLFNNSRTIAKWSLRKNGKDLYLSGKCGIGNTSTITLSNTSIVAGTQFTVKANCIGGKDSSAFITLEYDPTSTVIANFELEGNAFKSVLMYKEK